MTTDHRHVGLRLRLSFVVRLSVCDPLSVPLIRLRSVVLVLNSQLKTHLLAITRDAQLFAGDTGGISCGA